MRLTRESGYYVLIGQTPVPFEGDPLEWAQWLESSDRRVMWTLVAGTVEVSTVFLALDHGWGTRRPLLFETMAFWHPGRDGYEQKRCSTWAEAEAQHRRVVAEVSQPRAWLAFLRRRARETWAEMKADVRKLWREQIGRAPSEYEAIMDQAREMWQQWE